MLSDSFCEHRLANQTVDFYYIIKEAVPCYLCLITPFLDDAVNLPSELIRKERGKKPHIFCNENSCCETSCL